MFVPKVQASGSICGITPQGGGDRADTLERELHHIFYVISGERHSNTAVFSSCLAKVTGRLSAISGPANTAESQAPPFELSSNEASRLQASRFVQEIRFRIISDYWGSWSYLGPSTPHDRALGELVCNTPQTTASTIVRVVLLYSKLSSHAACIRPSTFLL